MCAPEDPHVVARRAAFGLLTWIGSNRDARVVRRMVGGRGVDPVAVRAAVSAGDGHPMTPPPAELETQMTVATNDSGAQEVCSPVWTTGGRSSWTLHVGWAVPSTDYPPSCHVDRLVHDPSGRTLDAATAPCPSAQGSGWVDDADFRPEEWPGAPDDPRIPRGAFVGARDRIRLGQIVDGVRRVRADATDVRGLDPGLGAVVLLTLTFSDLYADGIDAPYDRLSQPDFETAVVDACVRVGADRYAAVFARILATLPPHARGSVDARGDHLAGIWAALDAEEHPWETFADEIYALEDAGDLIWD